MENSKLILEGLKNLGTQVSPFSAPLPPPPQKAMGSVSFHKMVEDGQATVPQALQPLMHLQVLSKKLQDNDTFKNYGFKPLASFSMRYDKDGFQATLTARWDKEKNRGSILIEWLSAWKRAKVDGRYKSYSIVRYAGGAFYFSSFKILQSVKRAQSVLGKVVSPVKVGTPLVGVQCTPKTPHDSVIEEALAGELWHKELPKVFKWIQSKKPLWLWSAPAGGKNVMAEQIARILKVGFYPIYMSPTMSDSRIIGFQAAGTGDYVKGLIYEPWKNGGLVYLDEIDVADPQVLVATNSLSANDIYRFPNGEIVKRHQDFYLMAGANTLGRGSEGGMKRNSHDAATLSRFVKYHLNYDTDLEVKLCQHKDWARYVIKVRDFVSRLAKGSVPITPRCTYNGDAGLKKGIPREQVAECCLYSEMSEDTRKHVISNCGPYN